MAFSWHLSRCCQQFRTAGSPDDLDHSGDVSECHKRIDQLERRLTNVSDYCIELGADPDDVNELRYGPI